MSIEIMRRVWQLSEQKGSALLLLLAIADNANDDGEGWPGIHYLAQKTRMSERSVQRLLMDLSDSRELAVEWGAGRGSSNYYYILVGMPDMKIDATKRMVLERNRTSGALERMRKISEAVLESKKGDKIAPIEEVKGDNLTPINDGKGVIQDGKGDKNSGKGDTAVSPEPLNHQEPEEKDMDPPSLSAAGLPAASPEGGIRYRIDAPDDCGLPSAASLFPGIQASLPPDEMLAAVKEQLRGEMPRGSYLQFVEPLHLVGWVDGVFRVSTPDHKARDWVQVNLGRQIDRLLTGAAMREVHLEVQVRSG